MEILLSWNRKMNITAIREPDSFVLRHFVDSAACYGRPELMRARRVVDVGTGGGFPGLPLAMLMPDTEFTLMDSQGKRLRFLDGVIDALGIGNARTALGRAEDLARLDGFREGFGACVSRALAGMSALAEYCLPFVAVGGHMIAYKGDAAAAELAGAAKAIRLLGGAPARVAAALPETYGLGHTLVFVEKIQATPLRYPRRAGTPARAPL
jgi:16S rRNA (guanine527-N7)-methyltransferase